MDKKTEALKLAQNWYDSGNENPDDFADMIKKVIALAEQPAPVAQVRSAEKPHKQQEPLTQDMVESCPYHGETLRGAFFDGWIKAETAHGIYAPSELKENE